MVFGNERLKCTQVAKAFVESWKVKLAEMSLKLLYLVAMLKLLTVLKQIFLVPGKRAITSTPRVILLWKPCEMTRLHSAACWQVPFWAKLLLRLVTLQREQKGSWHLRLWFIRCRDKWHSSKEANPMLHRGLRFCHLEGGILPLRTIEWWDCGKRTQEPAQKGGGRGSLTKPGKI